MRRVLGTTAMSLGTYWLFRSGLLDIRSEIDRTFVVWGTGTIGIGLYLVGDHHGYNSGYRKGTQQVIKHHNECRKSGCKI